MPRWPSRPRRHDDVAIDDPGAHRNPECAELEFMQCHKDGVGVERCARIGWQRFHRHGAAIRIERAADTRHVGENLSPLVHRALSALLPAWTKDVVRSALRRDLQIPVFDRRCRMDMPRFGG